VKNGTSRAIVFFCAALAPLGALAQTQDGGNYPGPWGHPYMMGGWGSMTFGPIAMILFLGIVIVAIVLAVRWLGGVPAGGTPPLARKTPLETLQERFARGEIDKDEFAERKRPLTD
jgi:putative membrane protein